MEKYLFRDQYFALSEEGLHLLRNGFNYKTIKMSEISSIRVGKGKSIKNWFLLLLFGILILATSFFYGKSIWNFFTSPDPVGQLYIEEVAAVLIGILIGGYCVFLALKSEEVIEFKVSSGAERFATKDLKLDEVFDDMITFLKERKSVSIE